MLRLLTPLIVPILPTATPPPPLLIILLIPILLVIKLIIRHIPMDMVVLNPNLATVINLRNPLYTPVSLFP